MLWKVCYEADSTSSEGHGERGWCLGKVFRILVFLLVACCGGRWPWCGLWFGCIKTVRNQVSEVGTYRVAIARR